MPEVSNELSHYEVNYEYRNGKAVKLSVHNPLVKLTLTGTDTSPAGYKFLIEELQRLTKEYNKQFTRVTC